MPATVEYQKPQNSTNKVSFTLLSDHLLPTKRMKLTSQHWIATVGIKDIPSNATFNLPTANSSTQELGLDSGQKGTTVKLDQLPTGLYVKLPAQAPAFTYAHKTPSTPGTNSVVSCPTNRSLVQFAEICLAQGKTKDSTITQLPPKQDSASFRTHTHVQAYPSIPPKK
jgi:hypothetical protein